MAIGNLAMLWYLLIVMQAELRAQRELKRWKLRRVHRKSEPRLVFSLKSHFYIQTHKLAPERPKVQLMQIETEVP